jgi:hypothetical protein
MLRKLSIAAITMVGLGVGQSSVANADHCYHQGYTGYRPPVVSYGIPGYSSYRTQPYYGWSTGRPLYSGGYPGYSSYYGSGYGSGLHAPFGGYGAGGFPRSGSYGMGGGFGPGFSLYIGR